MFRIVSKPGPPSTSCSTCRGRQKKCDMSRPCCNRCLNGGYECLGYDDNQPRVKIRQNHSSGLVPATVLSDGEISEIVGCLSAGASGDWRDPTDQTTGHTVESSFRGVALLYKTSVAASATDGNFSGESAMDFGCLRPQDQSQSIVFSPPSTRQPNHARRTFSVTSGMRTAGNDPISKVKALYRSIPPSVDATQTIKENHLARIAGEYVFQVLSFKFMAPSSIIRKSLAGRVRGNRALQAMYLGASILRALNRDLQARDSTLKRYVGWIDKLEQRFTTDFRGSRPLSDVGDCLAAHIELSYLKFMLVDSASAYTLLRAALPKFLPLAAAEPQLLIEQAHSNLNISLPRTLGSSRYELARFAMYDVILAFLLGTTPLIEYGYEGGCEYDGFEWIHGIPSAFLQIISQVNSWRAGSRVHLDDWYTLERRVLAWESPYAMLEKCSPDSASFERATVQEGWRHVLLIYIYMGICGASSHDSRVQVSVDRILQLAETISSLRAGIHILPHCVVAGVAARLEKQRVAVYEKLMLFTDARPWLFCGPQFSQFLYHMWHGEGVGGEAVKWDDYVQSRNTVIPI
ncbi:unnamed protein product [Rhizoctonia solani]|uniref:Zn(2)-C6 fungal-type domain-containing protein n=1 Tax=Rhizoctonia solani TaxID=456999 RepID=A0A8H3GTG6_9AGAM|nr:unnamed protein product [Rhizoctonia solani]